MFFKIAVALHLKKYPEGPGDEVDSTVSAVMHFYVYLFACFSVSCFHAVLYFIVISRAFCVTCLINFTRET